MNNIEVSVAISCYNFEQYIAECITSILEQETNFLFEVIIVDDCSTDDSAKVIDTIIKKHQVGPKVTFVKQLFNQGSDATKQLACKLAKGKYIAFLDGDDFAYAKKLQLQYDYLQNNPDCSCCYHDVDLINDRSEKLGSTYFEKFYNQAYIPEKSGMGHLVQYGTFLVASSQMFIASAFKEDLLPTSIKYIQDFYYHIHTSSFGNLGRLNHSLGAYRQHNQSSSGLSAISNKRRLVCLQDMLSACDFAKQLGCSEIVVNKGKMHFYFAASIFFAKKNEKEIFSHLINKSSNGSRFFDKRHESIYLLAKESANKAIEYINSTLVS